MKALGTFQELQEQEQESGRRLVGGCYTPRSPEESRGDMWLLRHTARPRVEKKPRVSPSAPGHSSDLLRGLQHIAVEGMVPQHQALVQPDGGSGLTKAPMAQSRVGEKQSQRRVTIVVLGLPARRRSGIEAAEPAMRERPGV